jgi:hypothetical protein
MKQIVSFASRKDCKQFSNFQFIEQNKQTPTDIEICRGYFFENAMRFWGGLPGFPAKPQVLWGGSFII